MNRLLTKKKAPEAIYTEKSSFDDSISSQHAASPGLAKSPGLQKKRTIRWGKRKPIPEPKMEIDLTLALPSTEEFRTSLIMPNLSARFSMLREQDDPSSMLGKASDDSVLSPQRKSRKANYGYGADLADIAEVASLNGSIRPPFAAQGHDAFLIDDGYNSDPEFAHNGSIMSRARPGEGNVLFGGRQKVYMIPNAGTASTRSLGKAVYEDDIGLSAFQKHRQRERELLAARGLDECTDIHDGFEFGLDQAAAGAANQTPKASGETTRNLSSASSLSSSEKKRSTSSTFQSEARSSTPATSVASQPPSSALAGTVSAKDPFGPKIDLARSSTRNRRLYEQGLDQHMLEQQSSALTRLNSLHRQRGQPCPKELHTTRSAGNLNDRAPQPVYALSPISPDFVNQMPTLKTSRSNADSPNLSGPASPTSPLFNAWEHDDALNQALDPADRGKATAMGAFNKPLAQFDEQQYLERQRALQRSNSSTNKLTQAAMQQRAARFDNKIHQLTQHRSDSLRKPSARSRAEPISDPEPLPESKSAYNVFQKAAFANRAQAEIRSPPLPPPTEKPPLPDTHRTFFGDIGGSDSEEDHDLFPGSRAFAGSEYGPGTYGRWQPTVLPAVSEHPASKSEVSISDIPKVNHEQVYPPEASGLKPALHSLPQTGDLRLNAGPDSPTLGPPPEALSGMIQHLRTRSSQSSIYPDDEQMPITADPSHPDIPSMPYIPHSFTNGGLGVRSTFGTESRVDSTYASSNPWDLEESERGYLLNESGHPEVSPLEPTSNANHFGVSNKYSSETSRFPDEQSASSWQTELKQQAHTRDTSNATQQEREAFAYELAQRQKAIQESLAGFADTSSRDVSPVSTAVGPFKPFGMLPSKSSRESLVKVDGSSKALKLLGITTTRETPVPINSRVWTDSSSRPPQPAAITPKMSKEDHEAWRERELYRAREESASGRGDWTSSGAVSPPSPVERPATAGTRSRSNSEATYGRSRSRPGQHRDDVESGQGHTEFRPTEPTSRPSPNASQDQVQAAATMRARSNSRPTPNGYFDAAPSPRKLLNPSDSAAGGSSPAGFSPGLGPTVPSTAASPPAIPAPYVPTPPISGSNTPTNKTFPPNLGMGPKARKMNINKSDISEPTLISSTSNIDTVDLPPGASLKNGMDDAPPVPSYNPKRRVTLKLFGRSQEPSSESSSPGMPSMLTPPDPWTRVPSGGQQSPFGHAAGGNRDWNGLVSPRPPLHKQGSHEDNSTSIQQYRYGSNNGYPDRIQRTPPQAAVAEGGMF